MLKIYGAKAKVEEEIAEEDDELITGQSRANGETQSINHPSLKR